MSEVALRSANNGAIALPAAVAASLADWAVEMDAAHRIAKVLCVTSFVPKDFRNKPEETTAAIMTGKAMGLAPTTACQIVTVIQGRVGMYAKGQVAILMSHGHDVWTEEYEDDVVTVAGRRKGWPESRVSRITMTIEQAKRAGWTSNNTYVKTPRDMLYARAASRVCSQVAPELLYGIPVVEELADLPPLQAEATVARVTREEILGTTPIEAAEVEAPDLMANLRASLDDAKQRRTPAPPERVTREGLAANFELLTAAGYTDKADVLAFISNVLGRPVAARTELSQDELATVNARLRAIDDPGDHPLDDLGPRLLTDAQKRHIMVLAGELGLTDRDARLEYLSGIVGEPVASTSDLTGRQASDCIEAMLSAKAKQDEVQPETTLHAVANEQSAQLRRTRRTADGDGAA